MMRRGSLAWATGVLALCAAAIGGQEHRPDGLTEPAEPVMLADGEPIPRAELESWLLRERGALLAPAFARAFVVRQAAREAGVNLSPEELRAAVEAEIQERVAGAFGGRHESWVAELASLERSESGHKVERSLELETWLLLEKLAPGESLAPETLERRLVAAHPLVLVPALERDGPPEEAVLTVGSAPVSRAELGRWLRLYRGEVEARRFAESGALHRAAREAGVAVTPEEVAARARADTDEFVRSFYGGDREMWRNRLRKEGRTEEDHERQSRALAETTLLLEGVARARRTVGEEDVRQAFEERYGSAGEELRLRWIRIDVVRPARPDGASDEAWGALLEAAHAAALARAGELRARALEGQDFALLAERHSDDPETRARGGAPPDGFRAAGLAPELRAALADTPAGGVSAPVRVDESCWIFEVLERRPVDFEEVQDELRRELLDRPVPPGDAALLRTEILRAVRFQILPAMFADAEVL